MGAGRRRVAIMVTAGIAAACTTGAPSSFQSHSAVSTHPRIWLDASTLASLRARAASNTQQWQALHNRCEQLAPLPVEWPDGRSDPDNAIGGSYQGGGYVHPVLDLALCAQLVRTTDATAAQRYATRAIDIMHHMSEPSGPHAPNPLTDGGYGIRNYVFGMAMGYDWAHDWMSGTERSRVNTAINRWIDAYERDGFEHDFPQGNYFAGYYASLCMAALATAGENPRGDALWSDFYNRVQQTMVASYYAANLQQGGWPEGWNYGPLASLNMSWVVWAVRTARGVDLLHDPAPYAFPTATPRLLAALVQPSLVELEDSDDLYGNDHPALADPTLFSVEAGLLAYLGDPFAPSMHSLARAVRHVNSGRSDVSDDARLWTDFIFWDDTAPETDYRTLPLSGIAHGLEQAAARSSWGAGATWVGMEAGPFVNYHDNGEEYPDKGAFSITNGNRYFIVNAVGTLYRDLPGQQDGQTYEDRVASDLNGDTARRDLFNIFCTDRPAARGEGIYMRTDGTRIAMSQFDDAGAYVVMRGSHLQDEFPASGDSADRTITSWTRDLVFIRPNLVLVHDRTTVTESSIGQWMAFHVGAPPAQAGGGDGVTRWDVGTGSTYAGSAYLVLPAGHSENVVNVFNSNKAYRIEEHATLPAAAQSWLSVFDAARTAAVAASVQPLTAGTAEGAVITGGSRATAVLFAAGGGTGVLSGEIRYRMPARTTINLVDDLAAGTTYSVSAQAQGGQLSIDLVPGGSMAASSSGVLSFSVDSNGTVQVS